MKRKAAETVAEAIMATTRARKRFGETTSYRGILAVDAACGKYIKLVGAERLNREDAMEDAQRARQDWIDVNCLPS